jgi:Type II secretion system (T2SS), protein L
MSNHQMIHVFWDGLNHPEQLTVVTSSGIEQNLSLDELRVLVKNGAQLYLVLSSKSCSIYQIDLPKLSAKEIPLAIQSILEDKVLQNFSQLWWCYYKNEQGLYNVLVWDKNWLENVRHFFNINGLPLHAITIDWFALKPREILVFPSLEALIRSDATNAFLSAPLFSNWIRDQSFESHHIYSLKKSFDMPGVVQLDINYPVWIWQRFQEKPGYDIDTPEKKFDLSEYLSREQIIGYAPKVFLGSLGLITLIFLGLFVKNLFIYFDNLSQFKNFSKSSIGDLQTQLSRYQYQNAQKKQFWGIWLALQKSYQPRMIIQQIQFEQKSMQIILEIQSAASLQNLKNQLHRYRIKVTQSQVQSIPNGVRVILNLQRLS